MTLLGPFELSIDTIDGTLSDERVGVYAVGHVDGRGVFRIQRVGRGSNLRTSLRNLVGSSTRFKFEYSADERASFERECELFHLLRPPSNLTHPERPLGSSWRCPWCLGPQFQAR